MAGAGTEEGGGLPETRSIVRALHSIGWFGGAALVAAAASLLGSAAAVVVGLLGMAALAPVAGTLSRRLLLGFTWFAGVVGLAALVPSYPPGAAGLLPLLTATLVFVALQAGRSGWPDWRPQVHPAEVVVCVGSFLVLAALAIPVIGADDGVLLRDVATAWDNLPHFQSVAVLIADGPRVPRYNYGYHLVGSLLVGEKPPHAPGGAVLSLADYEALRFGSAWLCALVLGLLAVEATRALRPDRPALARSGALATGAAFVVTVPLTGFIGAYSLLGFGNFLWAVTAVAAASWLALDPRASGARAGLLTALGIVAAFAGYRSVQVGMSVCAMLVTKWALERSEFGRGAVRSAISLSVGSLVFAGWVPFHYYETSVTPQLAQAQVSGGAPLAIPPITILIELALLLALGLALVRRVPEAGGPLIRLLAPIPGFLMFAVAIGVDIARTASPLDSYYVWKPASAVAIVAFPAILAVAAALFLPRDMRGSRAAWWFQLCAPVVVVSSFLALLPNAGSSAPGVPAGLQLLDRRIDRLGAPGVGDSGMIESVAVLGDDPSAVLVLPDEVWGRDQPPIAASGWLDALRGIERSPERTEVAVCAEHLAWGDLVECVVAWAGNHPGTPLVIVDLDDRASADPGVPTGVTVIGDPRMR